VDHGIDGRIDLVEPGGGALPNRALLVQGKASNRPFSGGTVERVRHVRDERGLALGRSGNVPVILVFSRPVQDEAWWVDVRTGFRDAAGSASRSVEVDNGRSGSTYRQQRLLYLPLLIRAIPALHKRSSPWRGPTPRPGFRNRP
jgi:hypothetical protein